MARHPGIGDTCVRSLFSPSDVFGQLSQEHSQNLLDDLTSLKARRLGRREDFFRTGRVCNTTATSKNKLDNYKIIFLQPPHFQSPNQLHALVTLLASIGYPPIATASSTAIVLAHRGVARRGDYLLKILTWYNFMKDIVKSFSF